MDKRQQVRVQPARIGSPIVSYIIGAILIAIGIFGSMARDPIGGMFLALGISLIAWGVFVSLFRNIELRLMDIEASLKAADKPTTGSDLPPPSGTDGTPPAPIDTRSQSEIIRAARGNIPRWG